MKCKRNVNEFRVEKKGDKLYIKWKGYENFLTVGLIKKLKADLKSATGVDTWTKKVDLASVKSEINKWDVLKLETTPVDVSKLNDTVKN